MPKPSRGLPSLTSQLETGRNVSATPQTRERPLNRRYAQAIALLIDGTATTQKHAAKLANVRADELSRIIKTDKAQRFIQEQCSKYLKGLPAIRASATLAKLTTAGSEDVRARVSQRIVEHAGILAPHALPTGAVASPVPLLTIVMKHQAADGSISTTAAQVGGTAQIAADPSVTYEADHVLAKDGGDPGVPDEG